MSIAKIVDLSLWMKERRNALLKLTPEARVYKRIRGRRRNPEERRALVLSSVKAWNDWISSGKLVKTDKGYKLCKV